MYVEAICPACRTSHILPADMRGERYRCEECEELFIVNEKAKVTRQRPNRPRVLRADDPIDVIPLATEDRPRNKNKRDREPARKQPPRRVRSRVGLMMIVISGVLLLAGAGAFGAWWAFWGRNKSPAVAQDDSTKPDKPNPDDTPPKDRPRIDASTKSKGDTLKTTAKAPEPVGWKVKVDPPPKRPQLPADFTKDISGRSTEMEVVFPTVAGSLFVAVGDSDERQVWNLATNAPAGKLTGPRFSAGPPALAPDGAHLALVPFGQKDIVEVTDIATGKSVKIDTGFRTEVFDFAGADRIVALGRQGTVIRVGVWDVTTGKQEGSFDGPALGDQSSLLSDMVAISPGGAYLAVVTTDDLWIWDLKTGKAVGRRPLGWNEDNWLFPCSGLSFSPDGRELAAFFQMKNRSRLVCWDVVRSASKTNSVFDTTFDLAPVTATTRTDYERHVLSWVGDKRGWLVYGLMFVDRQKPKVGPWPSSLLSSHPPYRWMVDANHVASLLDGQGRSKVLTIRPFDAERPDG